ncbi:hypothetical protein [Spirosoma flavum]|uniref:Uncharacterized protein n=1 Tax=Spirosoma flavum TaxID=2048557 RepID=A0ABW6AVR5_9BACT
MKTFVVIGILLVSISGQAFSMGHPHNMFAARKQMQSKTSTSLVVKNKVTTSVCWQQTVQTIQATKAVFGERLIAALTHMRPARTY